MKENEKIILKGGSFFGKKFFIESVIKQINYLVQKLPSTQLALIPIDEQKEIAVLQVLEYLYFKEGKKADLTDLKTYVSSQFSLEDHYIIRNFNLVMDTLFEKEYILEDQYIDGLIHLTHKGENYYLSEKSFIIEKLKGEVGI